MIPKHEKKILEAHIRGVKLSQLPFEKNALDEYQVEQFNQLIKQRSLGFPLQYLINSQDFYGREFYVNTTVLIPRPETEGLVENVLRSLPEKEPTKRIYGLEIGTGSGCISITLALERPDVIMRATDCVMDAINVADENAAKFRAGNVEFVHVSQVPQIWQYEEFPEFDFIVSNPPYLTVSDEISKDVLEHEPHEALFAPENDAMYFYRFLRDLMDKKLKNNGFALFEINHNESQETKKLFLEKYGDVNILKDLTDKDRYIKIIKG